MRAELTPPVSRLRPEQVRPFATLSAIAVRLIVMIGLLALTPALAGAQTFPKFTGLVVDDADVLPPATEAALTQKLEALQKDTNRQLVVATIADTQGYPLDEYGYRLGRAWGVGLKDVNNGAILFIAPNNPQGQRGPRIEVGYGLEPVLTDALSSIIINTDMMPRLRDGGDIPGAMTAGADAIIAQLRASPDEAKARTDAAVAEFDRTHRRSGDGGGLPIGLIFWLIVLGFIVLPAVFRGRHGRGRAYRDGGNWPIVLWSIAEGLGHAAANSRNDDDGGSGWGGWGGGGSSGGWGGGSFSGGGGGSFGGGGASGSW